MQIHIKAKPLQVSSNINCLLRIQERNNGLKNMGRVALLVEDLTSKSLEPDGICTRR